MKRSSFSSSRQILAALVRGTAIATALLAHPLAAKAQHTENTPAVIMAEHHAALDLVRHADATHVAVQSGDWEDPATWFAGEIPGALAKVVIPKDAEVRISGVNRTTHKWVRVDGKLSFAPDRDTALLVDTIVVDPNGHLEMGTAANPIRTGVKSKLIIADTGDIDITEDPNELGRGLITHGRTSIHGATKTGRAMLDQPIKRRAKEISLSQVPADWRAGDVLVIPTGSRYSRLDSIVRIRSISGNKIQLDGLTDTGKVDRRWSGLDHKRHKLVADRMLFVINITRNAIIESQNITHTDSMGINRRRGHIMFMHHAQSKTDVNYAGIYGLGRTDKRTPLESPEFDANGNRVPGRGHNTVGRYAFHFHRGGPAKAPAQVRGLAIVDSPGLGLVNHSSHVEARDCVAFNIVGSAFFTEAGNENGVFENCTAVRIPGSGERKGSRNQATGVVQETDFGHAGHGFWLQGGGVTVRDAFVSGSGSSAIIFFTKPLVEAGLGRAVMDSSLVDARVAAGRKQVPVAHVPATLQGAYVFGSRTAVETIFHQIGSRHGVSSRLEGVVANDNTKGIMVKYSKNVHLSDSDYDGFTRGRARGGFMGRNAVTSDLTFENVSIRGFRQGIRFPVNGINRVTGGTFQNTRDMVIETTHDPSRVIDIDGDVKFLDMTPRQLKYNRAVSQRQHVSLVTDFSRKNHDISQAFARDVIRLGSVFYANKQLYFHAQAADYVPFPSGSSPDHVPAELLDKTNAQLREEFGLAVGDAVAPADAFVDPRINALIGSPTTYGPQLRLATDKFTNQLNDFRLRYRLAGQENTFELPETRTLREGWNLFTVNHDGHKRTLMVYGDITAPSFVLDSNVRSRINPQDLTRGFVIMGRMMDDSCTREMIRQRFSGSSLQRKPVLTRADGSRFIELSFHVEDYAGNRSQVIFELTLDPNQQRAHIESRKQLDAREVSRALLALLGLNDQGLEDELTSTLQDSLLEEADDSEA